MSYLPVTLPKLQRVDGGPHGRRYVTPEGNAYPSVTTVLASQDNAFLDAWRERVGEAEAKRIGARAAARGTYIHEQCEHLLKGTTPPSNPTAKMLHSELWQSFRPVIERIGDVYALEAPLYSDYCKTAGTVDCVGQWEGRRSIIDFKTSSRFKAKEDIDSYWMQCAFYAIAWEERTGQPIQQLVILMSVDEEQPLVYTDSRDNWVARFMSLREQYEERISRC